MKRALVAGFFACLLLGCPKSEPAPASTHHGSPRITEAELRHHVDTLASDAFLGRETLAEGAHLAAAYITDEMTRYGLQPMPGQESLQVKYNLLQVGFDESKTSIGLRSSEHSLELVAGEDFAPFSFSDGGELDADVVFAGYGISAPEADWDDYAGLDVKGKIVFLLRHTPHEDDEDAPLSGTEYATFRSKAQAAAAHGARGMLLVTDPLHHDASDDLRMSGFLVLPSHRDDVEGSDSDESKDEAPFLAAHISRKAADQLVAWGSARDLSELQTRVDAGTHPSELALSDVHAKVTLHRLDGAREVQGTNVVGFLPGSDPKLRDEWVVIGAHYDHLGAYTGEGDTIYNGADDNASGSSALLELAQYYAARDRRPKRSIVFAAFSGEEKGLLGSTGMLEQHILPAERVVFMQNYDMIGRNSERPITVYGDGYATDIREMTGKANEGIGLPLAFAGTEYSGASDHHPFFQRDIPVMFFFTGLHSDYHQRSDHADKIDAARMADITRVGAGILQQVADGEVTPRFIHRVLWLGATVQLLEGTDGAPAPVVTGVTEGGRGAKAGLEPEDVIVSFDGEPLEDPETIGQHLRAIQPGSFVEIGLDRAGEVKTIRVKRAKTGFLGVMLGGVGEEKRAELGLGDGEGILINRLVPDGPAEKAGVQAGDILVELAGAPVGPSNLRRELARIGAGEPVPVVLIREGSRVSLKLTLGERPE